MEAYDFKLFYYVDDVLRSGAVGILRRSSVSEVRAAEVLRCLYDRGFGTKSSDRRMFDELVAREVFGRDTVMYDESAEGLKRPSVNALALVNVAIALLLACGLVEQYSKIRGVYRITNLGRSEVERLYPELRTKSTELPMDGCASPR